jgi:hypothetical protein
MIKGRSGSVSVAATEHQQNPVNRGYAVVPF